MGFMLIGILVWQSIFIIPNLYSHYLCHKNSCLSSWLLFLKLIGLLLSMLEEYFTWVVYLPWTCLSVSMQADVLQSSELHCDLACTAFIYCCKHIDFGSENLWLHYTKVLKSQVKMICQMCAKFGQIYVIYIYRCVKGMCLFIKWPCLFNITVVGRG